MRLRELLEAVEVLETKGPADVEIRGVACDSRRVVPGGLFVAVPGFRRDGVEFAAEAVARGAAAVAAETLLDLGPDVAAVRVKDARRAAAAFANAFYGDLSRRMAMVGITGTNGKTTTAYMTRAVLRAAGRRPGLVSTVAYEAEGFSVPAARTTPEAPELHELFHRMKESGCDSVVMEVSSHALVLQRVHGIAFDTCVFTNLTQDHLDFHGDMEAYFEAKACLFLDGEPPRRSAINLDDPRGARLFERLPAERRISFGFAPEADVRAADVETGLDGTRFRLSSPWGGGEVRLRLPGRFNVYNALAALAVGGGMGIELPVMLRALEAMPPVPGRLEPVGNRRKTVFVDYAHTDDALRNVLSTLREMCPGKLVVVFGCGGNRDRGKRLLMGRVADELADFSLLTSDNPRNEDPEKIVREIAAGFSSPDRYEIRLDRREAIAAGLDRIGRRDILLVAGKGHETYQEIGGTVIPFDDREIVKELLS